MKKLIRNSIGALLVTGTLLTATTVVGQNTVVTTTPITSMGTISEFSPNAIVIKTENGTVPVSYSYSKTTTYVDEAGNPVSVTIMKSGLPVTVYYTKSADGYAASKVIVRKAVVVPGGVVEEKKTTTTTTETK
ncbi:MAG: hypothetical protein WCS65_01510 [Verrucomicrobiae bacterium]